MIKALIKKLDSDAKLFNEWYTLVKEIECILFYQVTSMYGEGYTFEHTCRRSVCQELRKVIKGSVNIYNLYPIYIDVSKRSMPAYMNEISRIGSVDLFDYYFSCNNVINYHQRSLILFEAIDISTMFGKIDFMHAETLLASYPATQNDVK
jgi:hypothetical protein